LAGTVVLSGETDKDKQNKPEPQQPQATSDQLAERAILDEALSSGALRLEVPAEGGLPRLVLADAARLRAIVLGHRDWLTVELVEALAVRRHHACGADLVIVAAILDACQEVVKDPSVAAHATSFHGRMLHAQGRWSEAAAAYARAAASFAACQRPVYQVTALCEAGECLNKSQDYPPAIDAFTQALSLLTQHHLDSSQALSIAFLHRDLAFALSEEGLRRQAEYHLEHARQLFLHDSPLGSTNVVDVLARRSKLASRVKDHNRAQRYLEEALALLRQLCPEGEKEGNPYWLGCLFRLGRVAQDREEFAQAQGYFERALACWYRCCPHEQYPHGTPDMIATLGFLAQSLVEQGEYVQALRRLDQGLLILDLANDADLAGLTDREMLGAALTLPALRSEALEALLPGHPSLAELRRCERAAARTASLFDIHRTCLVPKSGRPSLSVNDRCRELMTRWVSLLGRLHQRQGDPAYLEQALQVAELLRLWEEQDVARKLPAAVRDILPREHPWRASGRHEPPCSVAEALDRLHPNEIALIFMTGPERSYVLLLQARPDAGDADPDLSLVELPGSAELDTVIDPLLRHGMLSDSARARELGAAAYRRLLGPVAERLRGKDLLILPAGPIGKLPFALLVELDEATGHGRFLIEGHRLRYSPSLAVLPSQSRSWLEAPEECVPPFWACGSYVTLSPHACACIDRYVSVRRGTDDDDGLFDLNRSALVLRGCARTVLRQFWPQDEGSLDRLLHSCHHRVASHCLSIGDRLRRGQLEMIRTGEPPRHWAGVAGIGE
jgi:tetratricopeptide (TPR) repeat protein